MDSDKVLDFRDQYLYPVTMTDKCTGWVAWTDMPLAGKTAKFSVFGSHKRETRLQIRPTRAAQREKE